METQELRAALWLMPKPGTPLFDALKQNIDGLKPLFDDAHKFDPHVTLTSGIYVSRKSQVEEILDRTVAAAKSVPHMDIILQQLSFGKHKYRKVVLEVMPQQELVSLAMICRESFVILPSLVARSQHYNAMSEAEQKAIHDQASAAAEEWAKTEYRPHLSLVYSNIYSVTEANRRSIDQRLSDVFGQNYATRGIGWTNGRIVLVACEGDPEDWEVLGYRDL